jgi:phosphate transport system permease protein
VADTTARVLISLGGVSVIIAVLAIMVYLVYAAAPLFFSGRAVAVQSVRMTGDEALDEPLAFSMVDEYRGTMLVVSVRGDVAAVRMSDGAVEPLGSLVTPDRALTAISIPTDSGRLALGFDDGTFQIGTIGFVTDFPSAQDLPQGVAVLGIGDRMPLGRGAFVDRTAQGQLRRTSPVWDFAQPAHLPSGDGPVVRIDLRSSRAEEAMVALRADGSAHFNRVSIIRPLGGGRPRTRLHSLPVQYEAVEGRSSIPDWLFLSGDAAHLVALWRDGAGVRYARTEGGFVFAEQSGLVPPGRSLTYARTLLGAKTLILGDSAGGVGGAFAARGTSYETPDGYTLVRAHDYPPSPSEHSAEIMAGAIAVRDRLFATGDSSGRVIVRHMTSGKVVAQVEVGSAPRAVAITPKTDGLVVISADGRLSTWDLSPGHPEASVRALFGKVWYEGESEPGYVYQSSSGEDTAEVKYSLIPLIFGTIKATVYALLFAIPIAIFAAVYTSEMLHPSVRNRIKPVIETMASLPSVVLGFIAAIVIAPLARDWLPSILLAFFAVPVCVLCAAYLWQLVPVRVAARLTSSAQFALVGAVMLCGLWVAGMLGGVLERALFTPTPSEQLVMANFVEAVPREQWPEPFRSVPRISGELSRDAAEHGLFIRSGQLVRPVGNVSDPDAAELIARERLDRADIRRWLDGTIGGAWPGWFMLMTLPSLITVVLMRSRLVDPFLAGLSGPGHTTKAGIVELIKFTLTLACGLGLSAVLAGVLSGMGLDARDSVFGSFSQRNTLIVAIVMGFAIIPIIYTISEDAMSSVPGSLRSASLGCGATRWQTATRVVLPIAASGIFSACMIGLGRAAGETMIVLMATGNTPSMDWNIFSGFRTLAANIAFEIPEAPKDSTHYRILFLGGLCLFGLTFVVNTAAEIVRQRFRRRSAAL